MQRFTQLFQAVDSTTSTNEKVTALQRYFHEETAANSVWALYLFLGKTRKRLITSRILRDIFLQVSDIPEWLFEASYAHVGDSAETIALLLRDTPLPNPCKDFQDQPLHIWLETLIPQVKTYSDEEQQALIVSWWASLEGYEVFVLNKILTGAFRVGVSTKLVVKALAAEYDIPVDVVTHRLMGDFTPSVEFYQQLIQTDTTQAAPSRPYPFFLASPIDVDKFSQATMANWQAEWKWDGIRAQMIHRAQQHFIWSRGEDLITHQFPEFAEPLLQLPEGTVLDGEIVCWDGHQPLHFNHLQKRLGRKRVGPKLMAANPVHFLAYDLLEHQGEDIRERPLRQRRQLLMELLDASEAGYISYSQPLTFKTFEQLQALRNQSREHQAEGLMLKALESPYLVGRKRGFWWKYKVDPMTLDAVLIYAQAGSGKRANLFTDYTFALWRGEQLVPFAKAYSGLDNQEIATLDKWIRRHTRERFGPVRSVEPTHVFEIGFEGIAQSNRHKSGISVRFPRILRWRHDKSITEADSLDAALALLKANIHTPLTADESPK
ncbi:atp-dependent dna ligase [Leptolyngbya sp. Heron Island J]|uniref:ATP-dependent DNA ligase n=1 Tax=Leptolyngbya sp. Heron Island J TaxID=1385935 RepID=UPI0003B960AB|nr:ATP-dependent DNA ligase [Leptolyngbya sp. Heron Island J]ESA33292.1 atp-dependent dna ligase [Leptolyngbya sp. Heron Island J]